MNFRLFGDFFNNFLSYSTDNYNHKKIKLVKSVALFRINGLTYRRQFVSIHIDINFLSKFFFLYSVV